MIGDLSSARYRSSQLRSGLSRHALRHQEGDRHREEAGFGVGETGPDQGRFLFDFCRYLLLTVSQGAGVSVQLFALRRREPGQFHLGILRFVQLGRDGAGPVF